MDSAHAEGYRSEVRAPLVVDGFHRRFAETVEAVAAGPPSIKHRHQSRWPRSGLPLPCRRQAALETERVWPPACRTAKPLARRRKDAVLTLDHWAIRQEALRRAALLSPPPRISAANCVPVGFLAGTALLLIVVLVFRQPFNLSDPLLYVVALALTVGLPGTLAALSARKYRRYERAIDDMCEEVEREQRRRAAVSAMASAADAVGEA